MLLPLLLLPRLRDSMKSKRPPLGKDRLKN
jgi:hypothetical protein